MRLLVPLVLLAATLAPSLQAAAEEEPHVLARVHNLGPPVSVTLSVYDEDGDLLDSRPLELAQGERVVVEAARGVGEFTLALTWAQPDPHPLYLALGSPWSVVSTSVRTDDCPGPSSIDFVVSDDGPDVRGSGCLVLTRAAADVLAEARAAKPGVLRPSFSIPPPNAGDRGVMGGSLFEWRGEVTFLDAWGRSVVGHELRYLDHGGSGYSSTDGRTGMTASAEVDETVEVLRWLRGSTRVHAWSTTVAGGGSESSATSTSAAIERELRYDDAPGTLACAARNGLQGRTLRPGDTVASTDVCSSWTGPAWRAAAPLDIEGHRILPLYQLEESAERLLVGRVLLLDGVPYPLAMERYVLPTDGTLRARSTHLERYQPAGSPLALDGAPLPEPRAPLAPLDPLRGPAAGGIGARLPFSLAEASDAARADPTLRDLQELLARPDAALIGASYGVGRDEGSPFAVLRWALVFSAEGADPVGVLCERPDAALAVSPPARCGPVVGPTALFDPLSAPPSIGRDALPARGATFGDAATRWDATRERAGERVTYALYRAWEQGRAPLLAVGAGVPAALTPAGGPASGSADHVALELATGRTLASVQVVQAATGLGAAPLQRVGPSTLVAQDAPFADEDALPYIVGGGLGLALLALLGFLLYSRLVRARVLDSATRAAILDAVAQEPGLHASGVMERLGKAGGVTEYHLDVLVREGFLTSLATPGFRRYFLTGKHTPQEMRAIAALREGQNEKLLRIIRTNPGIPLQTLALEAGVSISYASRSVARLAEAGLVEKVQVGRAVTLHASEA
ncbi:MAG TPA: winged helix-turn-helix transcriptional regulator [Candidatus Thermoplasmatota archaeon]|nr:winged helix-turn-helix transcriptional regulator [Candidatus Thermoplasmatota archaeon]